MTDGKEHVMSTPHITEIVREEYRQAALKIRGSGCCTGGTGSDPITSNLYSPGQSEALPEEALQASLGCGNPTALARLVLGETVLDLGSGGGIDVLLSAKRVGPNGKVYGLDMTDEMLELARNNQGKAALTNVEFLKGQIENIPLPDESVDVIISNCVINLSADKPQVFGEAFRVLKPGGRLAVSDIVVSGQVPAEIRHSIELWIGCVAGALEESVYRTYLGVAGFQNIEIEPTRVYRTHDIRPYLVGAGLNPEAITDQVDGKFMSAFIRATKPSGRSEEK
jgi:SAM-dependent methyltransferase